MVSHPRIAVALTVFYAQTHWDGTTAKRQEVCARLPARARSFSRVSPPPGNCFCCRTRDVPMAMHQPQSPAQKLGCLISLSLGEFTALVQHKSDDTIPGSNITKALSIHSSHLTQWLQNWPGDNKKKIKKCSVRRRGVFQAILPLEVKMPRNRLLKLTWLTQCKYYVSKLQVWNIQLYAVFIFIYIYIYACL